MQKYDFSPVMVAEINEDDFHFYIVQVAVGTDGLEEASAIFEETGNYPNGPGWCGLIVYMLENEAPNLLDKVEYESEGDCFRATCQSEADCIQLATLIQGMIKDTHKLRTYLLGKPDDYDDM
jgi:hypothetical protein